MGRIAAIGVLAGTLALGTAGPVGAQDSGLLAVGEIAPDFALTGATRHGVLEEPIRLSDYIGETVVLAFFYRVRTPG